MRLLEEESLSDFEKLWCDFPQAWKLLVSSCQRKLVEPRQRSELPLFAPFHILPTFSCDECDAVYFTLQALRSHQMKADHRRREARRYVLASVCPVCKADFRWRPRVIQHLEVGAKRCVLAWKSGTLVPFSEEAVAAADRLDCEHRRRCKRELFLQAIRHALLHDMRNGHLKRMSHETLENALLHDFLQDFGIGSIKFLLHETLEQAVLDDLLHPWLEERPRQLSAP